MGGLLRRGVNGPVPPIYDLEEVPETLPTVLCLSGSVGSVANTSSVYKMCWRMRQHVFSVSEDRGLAPDTSSPMTRCEPPRPHVLSDEDVLAALVTRLQQ